MENDIKFNAYISGLIKLHIKGFQNGNFISEDELNETALVQVFAIRPNADYDICREYYDTLSALQEFYKRRVRLFNHIEDLKL